MNTVPAMLVRVRKQKMARATIADEKAHTVLFERERHERAEEILVQMGLVQRRRFVAYSNRSC